MVFLLRQDRDLSSISQDIQIHLTKSIQNLFYHLITLLRNELDKHLTSLINPQDDAEWNVHNQEILAHRNSTNYHQVKLNNILITLSSIMDLLRKCRVNVTLTIQIFSHLFHYINAWLFNRIVCYPELELCSHLWGEKFSVRLKSINNWADSQGLELPAECYLIKVNQLCLLLQSPKHDTYDVQKLISNRTFKLNSLQLIQILNNYIVSRNEPPISNTFRQA